MAAFSPSYTDATTCYQKAGITVTQVDLTANDYELIKEAEEEVESMTGRKFTSANAYTEILSGPKKDIIGYSGQNATSIHVSKYPLQSITALLLINTDGTTNTTYDTLTSVEVAAGTFESEDYWADTMIDPITGTLIPYGKITMKEVVIPTGTNNVKVSYTYGYSTVPALVKQLATVLTCIRMWTTFMGRQYNRLNSYGIPQQSVNKGDFYQRGMQMIEMFTKEADTLYSRIGKRPMRMFFSSGGDR